ncbi:sortase domain-bontaining protein [Streptomyces sp. ISL-11]|uniref:sortase domain-containing protein n=1 Tax=Streptomyces sp. ISL-11 TaxID=2819174 RepID=UPI001BE93828|nr:sortase [Streptomyces sp. ISL-11]MBT2383593.1 class F sortase [Streptomyces sp. ISL-11]
MPRFPVIAFLALAAALVTGCSLGSGGSLGGDDSRAVGTPASAEEPSRISIPSLGVDSALLRLGSKSDGTAQLPPAEKGTTAGWYTGGAKPGRPGAAVIIGHADAPDGQAVFHGLRELGRGAAIDVKRGDGKILHFTVTDTEEVDKSAFPRRKVYGPTSEPVLRLVTCAEGVPDRNLIVYAALQK